MNMGALPTEQRNQNTLHIDEVSTLEMLRLINEEDKKVAFCVEKHLEEIAAAVDAAAEKFSAGGRIVYCGAGTSGRMGFMDSAECPPTYGIPKERVIALMAGGAGAIREAVEGAEDNAPQGAEDLKAIGFCEKDVLVGLAASGRTPYVLGAAEYARAQGAVTVSITCNEDPQSPLNRAVDYPIGIYAGPEAITGSTRMKAGTVQKLVLNMFSTGIMVRTGKVYSNLMVNVQVSNEKLAERALRIIGEITGAAREEIGPLFEENGQDVSLTILMLLTGADREQACGLMDREKGHIKRALAAFQQTRA